MRTKLRVFIIAVVIGMVGTVGWMSYRLFTTGFSAKTEPYALEVFMARQIRHLAIPIEQRDKSNPVPFDADVLKESLPISPTIVRPAMQMMVAAKLRLARTCIRKRRTY